ncbi:MAG TPA: hypothetical protein VFI36_05740 [Arthrobacter sp.]|nr:hypothetical protein [Arthrobacter sp.]
MAARVRAIPDAGAIDLLDTMDAVDSEVLGVAEMLFNERPDLVEDLEPGGDLLILSSLWIDPKFRGSKIGHTVLQAILGTVGRVAAQVVLQASPGPHREWTRGRHHEAHRDLGGMAAGECNRLSHILDTPRTRSMAV